MKIKTTDPIDSIAVWFGNGVLVGGILIFGLGIVVLGFQLFSWLKHGHWLPLQLGLAYTWLGLPMPSLSWFGVQKIVNWIFESSLSAGLMVCGLIVIFFGPTQFHNK
jgi:hypothetical protein